MKIAIYAAEINDYHSRDSGPILKTGLFSFFVVSMRIFRENDHLVLSFPDSHPNDGQIKPAKTNKSENVGRISSRL